MKHKAIFVLYPKARTVNEEDGVLEVLDENGNEISIDTSAVETKAIELQTAKDNEVQAKKDLKVSAKAKLVAGEPLTEAEADTLKL